MKYQIGFGNDGIVSSVRISFTIFFLGDSFLLILLLGRGLFFKTLVSKLDVVKFVDWC